VKRAKGAADGLPESGGCYVLLLRAERGAEIAAGSLGPLRLRRGWYLYIGSAFGPGGLRARVGRHSRRDKRLRWHVDYLRAETRLAEVWHTPDDCECEWAGVVGGLPGAENPLARFGASDCRCVTHLWYFPKRPSLAAFRAGSGKGVFRWLAGIAVEPAPEILPENSIDHSAISESKIPSP